LLLAVSSVRAQQVREFVRLAKDFNATPVNGNPSGLLVSGDKLYFVGTDGTHGIELWQTDGTNITRLTDLSYGSANSFIGPPVEFNGELYFRGSGTTNGTIKLELWKYDGTNASLVAQINPGTGSGNPSGLRVYNGVLYFAASDGSTGTELWGYDGVNAFQAADINPGNGGFGPFQNSRPQGLKVIGDRLYFSADDGVSGREIWSFDGTTATRLADLNPGKGDSEPFTDTFDFTEFDGAIYFSANPGDNTNRLFRYDGQKIERVDRVVNGPYFNFMMDEGFLKVFDGALYFSGGVDGDNFDRELWKFDGTSISRAADIFPGPAGSHPRDLFVFNDTLYFAASGDVNGDKLYKFDGTTASVAADVAPARSETGIDRDLGVLNADLYYTNGGHLWRFDGTNASAVADVDWNGNLAVLGGAVYLTGQFQPNGLEMARYDGQSVSLAADMRAGTESSYPGNYSSFNDQLYFTLFFAHDPRNSLAQSSSL